MTALRTLKTGLRGPDVVRWQRFLNIEPDGIFGPKTREATIAFQHENGLEPDGVAGPNTFGAATARGLETIRRLLESEATDDIRAHAQRILRSHFTEPYGTEIEFESNARRYIARIEEHYHPPGGPQKPWGPHTGVSIFVPESSATAVLDDGLPPDQILDVALGNDTPRFHLSPRSLSRLEGVHPDLVRVIKRAIAITPIDFAVLEGTRSLSRQRELLASGASRTLRSRHLTGHAVDIAPLDGGEVSWAWPLFHQLAGYIKAAAEEQEVPIEWGGDWKTFPDGPHWQLPWEGDAVG